MACPGGGPREDTDQAWAFSMTTLEPGDLGKSLSSLSPAFAPFEKKKKNGVAAALINYIRLDA